jgi:hypothetical protein
MEEQAAYPCLCCGYRTFAAAPPGTYIVCPVCLWEDLPVHIYQPEAYGVALRRAQRTFLELGAVDPRYCDAVRPPEPAEQRTADWLPIDEQIEALGVWIGQAFADVTRDDGMTLHEAAVLDGYGSDAELAAARLRDTDRHWRDVPDAAIERLWTALMFLDDKGFHYYLPAYMWWTLRHYDRSDSLSVDAPLDALTIKPWDHSETSYEEARRQRFRLLTEAQAQVVCAFLRFLVTYGHGCVNVEMAHKALDQYWGRFCHATDDIGQGSS